MVFEAVELPGTKFRIMFSTNDLKELPAHLETLDVLQVRRPQHLRSRRRWWAADVWMEGEDSPLRVYAAPEDVEYEIANLKRKHAEYFSCDVRITGLRHDNLN